MPRRERTKDPDSTLDYGFDWSDWLEDGESITSSSWTIQNPSGENDDLQIDTSSQDGSKTKVWLTDGTLGVTYRVTNTIETDNSPTRTDERSFKLNISER